MKKIISLVLLMLLVLASCDGGASKETQPEESSSETTPETDVHVPENAFLLYDGTEFVAKLIRASDADSDTLALVLDLKKQIEELIPGEEKFPIKDDYLAKDEEPFEHELIVGNAKRESVTNAVNALGNVCGYTYSVTADTVFVAGTIPSYTRDAIREFSENYLEENLVESDGKYYLKGASVSYVDEDPFFIDVAVLCASKKIDFSYTSKLCYNLDALGSHKSAQGACIDDEGKYLYVSMQTGNISSMAKYDLATGMRLDLISETGTDHSNDMTFNTKDDTIVVVHNAPNYARLSTFKSGTMEKIKTFDISVKMNGIAYCEERNQYAAGISGTWNFAVLDENFNVVSQMSSGVNTGKTRQGLDCNEDYVYFVQSAASGNAGNIIMVYSWQGTFLARIELTHNTQEGETLIHVGNTLYLHCNRGNGGSLFELTPVIPE